MKKFTFLTTAFALLVFLAIPLGMLGQEVTLDFTSNGWGLPEGSSNGIQGPESYTSGDYTITLEASTKFYYNTDHYLLFGKTNSKLTLPAFSFDVERIEVVGTSSASTNVVQNIYVGDTAVSTATTGAQGTNTYMIDSAYQAAGNIYTLMVTSNHNTQVTEIKVYAPASTDPEIQIEAEELALPCTANNYGVFHVTYTNGFVAEEAYVGLYYDANCYVEFDGGWISLANIIENPSNIPYVVEANNGTEARTVYMWVQAVNDEGYMINAVFAITQAAPETPHYTWNLAEASYDEGASADLVTWSCDYATMTNAKGSSSTGANNYLGGGDHNHTRFYMNQVLTITPVLGYAIDSVVITSTSSNYAAGFIGNDWTNAVASRVGKTVTVIPTDGDEAISVVISENCRAKDVTVYYETLILYNIQLSCGEHGSLTADKTVAQEGDTVIITVTPDPFYYVAAFGFAYCSGGNLQYYEIEPDVYAVIMPACDIQVSAGFNTIYDLYTITVDEEIENGSIVADLAEAPEGATVTLTVTPALGYYLEADSLVITPASVALTQVNNSTYTFDMPAEDVNVTAVFTLIPPTTYTLATTIENGRHYIIVGKETVGGETTYYAMGQQNDNNRAAVEITVDGNVATVAAATGVYEFVINEVGITKNAPWGGSSTEPSVRQYTIYDPASTGYLYAASSGSNYLRTETHLDANDNGLWLIAPDYYTGVASIVAFGNNSRNRIRFNSSNDLFSCYASGQQDVYLYEKMETTPTYDYYKDVKGYGTSEGGYCMIATPTNDSIDPAGVGMIATDGTYDLYGFDFTKEKEWRNYKVETFDMNNGQGYLYASQGNVTLHFKGVPCYYDPNSGSFWGQLERTVSLQFDENNSTSFNGWNLIGNPLPTVAEVYGKDFYVMNSDGTDVELAERDYANPMEGIFVQATEENQTVTFIEWLVMEPGGWEDLGLRVSGDNGSSDFARIRFGEGQGVEKFQLNPNHTKLYFTQGSKDYAVVHSAKEGEMPVSFKAAEDGTYTLTVSSTLNSNPSTLNSKLSTLNSKLSTLNFKHLHLIDNLTGAEVDLLANPTYTFQAKTTDNANRFRLVFSE